MGEPSENAKAKNVEAQASNKPAQSGSGADKVTDPKVEQATNVEEKKPFDYDEHYANLQSEREVVGGEEKIASGLDKGRVIKEDGNIDYDSPSDLETRLTQ